MFREAGFDDARLMEVPSGYPPIYGEIAGPEGSPVVVLYAHYDVQPAPPEQGWTTDPFTPTRKDDGRIYGRGAADDISGLVAHLGTLRVFDGKPPCTVKLILEGMEETESNLEAFVEAHPELFACDLFVICDMGNLRVGEPALTTALRGDVACVVTVRTLDHPLHSGVFGGPAPDAMMALARLLSTLHDDEGNVAVEGVSTGVWDGEDLDAGGLPQQRRRARRRRADRHRPRGRPAVGPAVDQRDRRGHDEHRVVLERAHPRGQREDLDAHRARLGAEGRARRPRGAPGDARPLGRAGRGAPHQGGARRSSAPPTDRGTPRRAPRCRDAYGRPAGEAGCGGSIPLLRTLQQAAPGAEFVLWGPEDVAGARIHASDESVDPSEIEKLVVAQALLLQRLADGTTA